MTAPEQPDVRPVPGAREADLVWARTASVEEILEFVGGRVDHELLGELLRARLDQVQVEAFERGSAAAIAEERPAHNEARAEVERLRVNRGDYLDTVSDLGARWHAARDRAEAAEAKLRDVEALADEWTREAERIQEFADRHQGYYLGVVGTRRSCRDHLRAVLARSQPPQAPAEQEGLPLWREGHSPLCPIAADHDGPCPSGQILPAQSVRPDAAADDDEMCRCDHPRDLHDNGAGYCRRDDPGSGWMCACTEFRPADDEAQP